MTIELSPALAALGIGIALAAAPGPVQAVLLSEAVWGGIARGLRALAGVHVTFGLLLLSLALGLSVATPAGLALRILKVGGGLLLLWLAADAIRSKGSSDRVAHGGRTLPPSLRGALAIFLNPGGWLFLGTVASPLVASAAQHGGRSSAVLAAAALAVGTAIGDLALVLAAGLGLRRARSGARRLLAVALATILAGLGVWLLASGALAP